MTSEGSQVYIDEILDTEPSPDLRTQSEIVKFFTGQNVLVTGGSGFVGKLLIEKLLRCCPGIGKMYIIMRPKKGKSAEERFKEQFEDIIYDRLRKEYPKFHTKIVMVEGDTGMSCLGLLEKDRDILRQNVNVIFHAAATVRFDEKLRVATNVNIRALKQMFLFAKEMSNLQAFVHISTAFAHCVSKYIEEKYYDPPIGADDLLKLVDILTDEQLEVLTPTLLGKYPNTYALTKAVAEDIVRKYSTGIPTCIVRPSIMVATYKEPIAGWIDNLYGPTGVVMGAGIGLLRTLHCEKNNVADIIPADYVISNIVVAAWDIAKRQSTLSTNMPKEDITDIERVPIYNYVSSCQKSITWGKFLQLNKEYGMEVPSEMVLWYYMFTLNRNIYVHYFYMLFLHFLPAAIIDTIAFLIGRKPMLLDAYRKVHKFSKVISYFSMQQWKFENGTVLKLWDRLNPADRQLFEFNMESLNWQQFFFYYIRGLRVYLMKDPIETLEKGRTKYHRLKIAHYTLVTIISLLLLWGVIVLLKSVLRMYGIEIG